MAFIEQRFIILKDILSTENNEIITWCHNQFNRVILAAVMATTGTEGTTVLRNQHSVKILYVLYACVDMHACTAYRYTHMYTSSQIDRHIADGAIKRDVTDLNT